MEVWHSLTAFFAFISFLTILKFSTSIPVGGIQWKFDREDGYAYSSRNRQFNKSEINWRIDKFSTRYTLTNGDLVHVIKSALDTWSEVIPIEFRQITNRWEQVDISIRFLDSAFDDIRGESLRDDELARCFCYLNPVLVRFNGNVPWVIGNATDPQKDLFTVALHELGHALGLRGHASEPYSLMAKDYSHRYIGISDDVVREIQALYGARTQERSTQATLPRDQCPHCPSCPQCQCPEPTTTTSHYEPSRATATTQYEPLQEITSHKELASRSTTQYQPLGTTTSQPQRATTRATTTTYSYNAHAFGYGQRYVVYGKFRCGGRASGGFETSVKLVDKSLGPDTNMGKMKCNVDGTFRIDGTSSTLIGSIDPELHVYTDCDDGLKPCQRKLRFKMPKKYIGDVNGFDIGVFNLENYLKDELRDCWH